jgi:hypothetical protein
VRYLMPTAALARFERMRLLEGRRRYGADVVPLLGDGKPAVALASGAWRGLRQRLRLCARWVRRVAGWWDERRHRQGGVPTLADLCDRAASECELRELGALAIESDVKRQVARIERARRRRAADRAELRCPRCGGYETSRAPTRWPLAYCQECELGFLVAAVRP